jgi:23S rRNA A2030 N6-methylase RlmJ
LPASQTDSASSLQDQDATAVERKPKGTTQTKRLLSSEGLEAKKSFLPSGQRRNIFLDIPFYRSGHYTHPMKKDVKEKDFSLALGEMQAW